MYSELAVQQKNNGVQPVVITAMGMASSAGFDERTFWTTIMGQSTRGRFNSRLRVDDKLLDSALNLYLNQSQKRRMDRLTQLGVFAALSCVKNGGLQIDANNKERIGCIFNCTYGPMTSTRLFVESYIKNGPLGASPIHFPNTVGNAPSGQITILLGCTGANSTVSGYNPLVYGYDLLRMRKADALIVGGYEELTEEIEAAHLHRKGVGSLEPGLMAPFPLLAEGAASILIEPLSSALARRATPLAEIVSYGLALSQAEGTKSVDGADFIKEEAVFSAMAQATQKARISLDRVVGIISLAHESSPFAQAETMAVQKLFQHGSSPSIFHSKNVLGETFGANDCFNVIIACLAFKNLYFIGSSRSGTFIFCNSFHIGGNVFSLLLKNSFNEATPKLKP